MISNKKCTTDEFIKKSKNIFGDLYDYKKVEYVGNKIKVELICKEHGSFLIRPNDHLTRKTGCQKCNRIKTGLSNRNKNWLNDFISIHGDLYDYSKVDYVGSKIKVEIICKEHGSFFMKPNSHLTQKQGCLRCSGRNIFNISDFIKEANKIHKNNYDYSKSIYIKSNIKMKIICRKHGSFFMKPKEHIHNKQGCPKCGKECMSDFLRKDINILLEQFNKIHNYIYDYSKIEYKNTNIKVDIICKKHGLFKQFPKSHLRGDGCPKCSLSKGETKIILELNKYKTNYISQKTFTDCLSYKGNKLSFDFYLPDYNTCIEYDGEQHFKPINYFGGIDTFNKQKLNDNIKDNYCLDNNIKLIRIPFNKFNEIEDILLSKFYI